MKLYRQDVRICGTLYIKAKSYQQALTKVTALRGKGIDIEHNEEADIPISGLSYDHPSLPVVSLSPAMTLLGIEPGDKIELVEHGLPSQKD